MYKKGYMGVWKCLAYSPYCGRYENGVTDPVHSPDENLFDVFRHN
jgi:hypothetical protein